MNSYKLGFGLIALMVIFMAYFYSKPDKPIAAAPAVPPANPAQTVSNNTFNRLPVGWQPDTAKVIIAPAIAPAANTSQALDTLLMDIDNMTRELSMLQNQLYNQYDQSMGDVLLQTYQPRIDELSQRLEQKVREAESLSKPLTQRFLWELALSIGLEDSASAQIISFISTSLDTALFEDILTALSIGGHNSSARMMLVFSILLPSGTAYYDTNTPPSPPPRQQRIQAFLEAQFQQETDPEVLNAYLEVYRTMSQDQHGLVPTARFWQQLEMLRSRLAPDQYFSFRLQATSFTDPTADIAGLLREMMNSPMTPEQRQNLQSMLSNTLFINSAPSSTDAMSTASIPAQHQQALLQYLENGLITPVLQNRYSLYEYGNQAYAIEMLKHGEQAANTYYQRTVDSRVPAEQVALLLGASVGGDALLKKLRQNTTLRQSLENQLKQSNLTPEAQSALQDALSLFNEEPLMLPEPTFDNEPPAAQYPGY